MSLTILTPAKINLFFELLGKRSDGYHDVATLVAPIEFYDTVEAVTVPADEAGSDGVALQCDVSALDGLQPEPMDVPDDCRNLVYKAAKLLHETYRVEQGVSIKLTKRIPPQSGLGGGSGNAAGTLRACAKVWNLDLSTAELTTLGAKLGSDVPLFFSDGATLATGRGEILDPKPVQKTAPIVIIRPPIGLSTPGVYKRCVVPQNPKSVEEIISAMTASDWETFNKLIFNRLEFFAAQLTPWVERCRSAIFQTGAAGGCLCGSGSCYFGIYETEKAADDAAESLKAQGWKLAIRTNVLM